MPKKIKLTEEQEQQIQKLSDEIERQQHILRWQKYTRAKRKLLELKLRYDYRSYRQERLLDKYLVSLRYKKKRPKGLGWLDDA
jgi:hypothetical protein|tara:strand:+ start:609 stop:857 length:249 start_codon:yes stop_codon:yes gene_type:complete